LQNWNVLDRDGTLIRHRHYLNDPAHVELIPGVGEGLRTLRALGLGLVVVTNQSAMARGLLTPAALAAIHARMNELLSVHDIVINAFYTCPHHPDDCCACRKPLPGLLHKAAKDLGFFPAESYVIGDKACDIGMGAAAGATTILIRNEFAAPDGGDCPTPPNFAIGSFAEAVECIRKPHG
jgi:D-glycero-D-manno-heptose 1,7-bisphosphate phosphatase